MERVEFVCSCGKRFHTEGDWKYCREHHNGNYMQSAPLTFLIEPVIEAVREELLNSYIKFPSKFNSMHEGHSVIREELEELFETVRFNDHSESFKEAVQVAAMAIRYIADLKFKYEIPA